MFIKITFQQSTPENANTIVIGMNETGGYGDADYKARDIYCRNLTAERTVKAKSFIVEEFISSESYAPGMLGVGFKINAKGQAEFSEVVIRDFLEVPELRNNRISVVGDQFWFTTPGTFEQATLVAGNIYHVRLRLEEDDQHEFEADDIIMTKYRTATGFKTGLYHVLKSIDNFTVQLQPLNGVMPEKGMVVARIANYTKKGRQNSIFIDGRGGYQQILTGLNTPEIKIGNIMYHAGNFNGMVHPVFGALPESGVLCTSFFGLGKMWVEVKGKTVETGAHFKVLEDEISLRVTKNAFDSQIRILGDAIDARVTSDDFTVALIEINKGINAKVSKDEFTAQINVINNSIKLIVTADDLLRAGIFLDGENSSIDIRADKFTVKALDGTKLISANAEGNRVTLRNIDIEEGAFIGRCRISDGGLTWLNFYPWETPGSQVPPDYVYIGHPKNSASKVLVDIKSHGAYTTALRVLGRTDLPGVLCIAHISASLSVTNYWYSSEYWITSASRIDQYGQVGRGNIFRVYHNLGQDWYVALPVARTTTVNNWYKQNAVVLDKGANYFDVAVMDVGNGNVLADFGFDVVLFAENKVRY